LRIQKYIKNTDKILLYNNFWKTETMNNTKNKARQEKSKPGKQQQQTNQKLKEK